MQDVLRKQDRMWHATCQCWRISGYLEKENIAVVTETQTMEKVGLEKKED